MPVAPEHAGGGPFYFAWATPDETTFSSDHVRYDEYIFLMTRVQNEGDFARMTIEISNPFEGLIAPGRNRWAWLAVDDGSDVMPLFFGELIAIPNGIKGRKITLEFIARPTDYPVRKHTAAQDLKVRPYWDPVFLDEEKRDDADAILEGYSASWHIDPVTHEVSISDWLNGEDGLEVFDAADVFYRSLDVTFNEAPLTSVKVDASVDWTQKATGTVNIGSRTFIGDGFLSGWPKTGSQLSGGWSVAIGTTSGGTADTGNTKWGFHYKNVTKYRELNNDEIVTLDVEYNGPRGTRPGEGIELQTDHTVVRSDQEKGIGFSENISQTRLVSLTSAVRTELVLRYDAARKRTERLSFTLAADTQPILGSSESEAVDSISITGADVGTPIVIRDALTGEIITDSDSGIPPIEDASRRSYFPTDHGRWSIEYLIMLARTRLIWRSRAVSIPFECKFSRAIALSLRKSALVADARLSGGEAAGKVIALEISAVGSTGRMSGKVTIGCAVGYGTAIDESDGGIGYIEPGYIEAGYYFREGQVVGVGAADVAYTIPMDASNDDGLVFPLTRAQAVVSEVIRIGPEDPAHPAPEGGGIYILPPTIGQSSLDLTQVQTYAEQVQKQVENRLTNSASNYDLTLVNLTGSFENQFDIEVSRLVLPQQVDLEASA
jgi:hypothetical protein